MLAYPQRWSVPIQFMISKFSTENYQSAASPRSSPSKEICRMNLVSFALKRPMTILVLVIAVVLVGVLAIKRMPRDIFPNLGVPVIYVAQPYGGMDPAQMEGYLTYYYEYHFLYITGIDHVESKSIQGAALMKLHIDYEQQPEHPLERRETGQLNWRVEKMSLSKDKSQLK